MTYVYRAFAKDGRLLYVGCSDTFERRIMQHLSSGSLWIHDAESFSLEYHPTRKVALAAEREAIRTEWPLYNIDQSIDPETPRLLHLSPPPATDALARPCNRAWLATTTYARGIRG